MRHTLWEGELHAASSANGCFALVSIRRVHFHGWKFIAYFYGFNQYNWLEYGKLKTTIIVQKNCIEVARKLD
jgi:hypothetical protein